MAMTEEQYQEQHQELIHKLKPILAEHHSSWNWKWDQEYRKTHNTMACTARFSHADDKNYDIMITIAYYSVENEKIRVMLSGEMFEYKYDKPQFDFYVTKNDEPQLFEELLNEIKESFGKLREELIDDLNDMIDIVA
jgi:hypothetical protein